MGGGGGGGGVEFKAGATSYTICVLYTETNIVALFSTKSTKCCTDYRDKYRISLFRKVYEMLY